MSRMITVLTLKAFFFQYGSGVLKKVFWTFLALLKKNKKNWIFGFQRSYFYSYNITLVFLQKNALVPRLYFCKFALVQGTVSHWPCVLIFRCKIFCNSRKKKHYMVITIISTILNNFEEYCFVILSLPENDQKHSKSVVFHFPNAVKDYIFLPFLFPKFVKGKLSFPSLLNWKNLKLK